MNALANTSVYTDFSGLTELKATARTSQDQALDEVAKQFEAMYMHMMLKSMRKAKLAEGLFDSKSMESYQQMYDQQLALHLSENGGLGLAGVLKKQLGGLETQGTHQNRGLKDYLDNPLARIEAARQQAEELGRQIPSIEAANVPDPLRPESLDGSVKSFVETLWPYAQKAAAGLGLRPEALLAQAALETGWGKFQMKLANGKESHNLFGIKADGRWDGRQASVSTLEYQNGVAKREKASFRAYENYQQSFDDYVDFIRNNPRYENALKQTSNVGSYFDELQQAGYATDPDYAKKVMDIFRQGDIQQTYQNMLSAEAI